MAGGKKRSVQVKVSKKKAPKMPPPKPTAKEVVVSKKRNTKRPGLGMVPSNKMEVLNESDFVKLTLDPCYGPLTRSPFGASENAYLWRLNYRTTINSNPTGFLMAALNPLGIYAPSGSGGSLINLWNQTGLSESSVGLAASSAVAIPGVSNFGTLAAQVRVTAGCIKLTYVGPAQTAQGELIGWEGQGDEVFTGGTALTAYRGLGSFALNGVTQPVTAGVESRLNYAKVGSPNQWQFGDPNVARNDVFCPMAVVGVSGGGASQPYIVEATIIVEWTPSTVNGIPAPSAVLLKPGAAERVGNALKMISPVLVSAINPMLGGYAGAVGSAVKFAGRVASALMT